MTYPSNKPNGTKFTRKPVMNELLIPIIVFLFMTSETITDVMIYMAIISNVMAVRLIIKSFMHVRV